MPKACPYRTARYELPTNGLSVTSILALIYDGMLGGERDLEAGEEGEELGVGDGLVVGAGAATGGEAPAEHFQRSLEIDKAWLDAEPAAEPPHGVALGELAHGGVDDDPAALLEEGLDYGEELGIDAGEDRLLLSEGKGGEGGAVAAPGDGVGGDADVALGLETAGVAGLAGAADAAKHY